MQKIKDIISSSILYSLLVFGAGFICGSIRVPIVQPLLGDRHAQLLEMPIMLVAMWRSADFVVGRLRDSGSDDVSSVGGMKGGKYWYFALGLLALGWLLAAEAGLYLWINEHEGKGIKDWIMDRDPVAGAAFFGMLGLYAVLPALLS